MTKLVLNHKDRADLWAYLDLKFAEDHIDRSAEPSQIIGKIPTAQEEALSLTACPQGR